MSKPTHLLIEIEQHTLKSLQILVKHAESLEDIGAISVDLSEEAIHQKAQDYSSSDESPTYRNNYEGELIVNGYRQCAKDLLNTK